MTEGVELQRPRRHSLLAFSSARRQWVGPTPERISSRLRSFLVLPRLPTARFTPVRRKPRPHHVLALFPGWWSQLCHRFIRCRPAFYAAEPRVASRRSVPARLSTAIHPRRGCSWAEGPLAGTPTGPCPFGLGGICPGHVPTARSIPRCHKGHPSAPDRPLRLPVGVAADRGRLSPSPRRGRLILMPPLCRVPAVGFRYSPSPEPFGSVSGPPCDSRRPYPSA